MDVLTPRPGSSGGNSGFLTRLEQGQQLRAVALDNARDGQVRVQLGARSMVLATQAPIQRGDTLMLQVNRQNADVQFRLLERISGQPMAVQRPVSGLQHGQHIVARLQQATSSQWLMRSDSGQTLQLTPPAGAQDRPGQAFLLQALGQPTNRFKLLQRLEGPGSLLWVQGRDMQQWRSLAPGQQISGLAMETVRPGATALPVRVMIGENVISLETRVAIQRGQQLQLQLLRLEPQPLLQLKTTSNQSVPAWQWLQAQALPRQQHVATALAGLFAAGSSQPGTNSWLDALLKLIPGLGDISKADSLRNTFLNSGILLEARLAHAPPGQVAAMLAKDLKAQLLRLREVSDPRSPIGRMVDGLLADLELQQARSLHARQQGDDRLALSLLMREQQEVHAIPLVLEREASADGDPEKTVWRVRLEMDLERLGAFSVVISYSQLRGVGVRFISDQAETREQLDAHLSQLRHRLDQRQLAVMGLSVTRTDDHNNDRPGATSTISIQA